VVFFREVTDGICAKACAQYCLNCLIALGESDWAWFIVGCLFEGSVAGSRLSRRSQHCWAIFSVSWTTVASDVSSEHLVAC
jgi:hypothetical protein